MTEPKPSGGDAVPGPSRIALDPIAGVFQRRANGAETSELLLADEVRRLQGEVARLQARLAVYEKDEA